MNKRKLQAALRKRTHCGVQHDRWPCGTCFFAMSKRLANADWQAVLLKRGDYAKADLDNLPSDIEASLRKTYRIATETVYKV